MNGKHTTHNYQTLRLRAQLSVLNDIVRDYPGRTVENIIENIKARINAIDGKPIQKEKHTTRGC